MIKEFSGPYSFLSNFYLCTVNYRGYLYPSAEHAYQAAKATNLIDFCFVLFHTNSEGQITGWTKPGVAKKRGKFDIKARKDWEHIKVAVMREVVLAKFSSEPLRTFLKSTKGHELIEGNTWRDRFWGVYQGEGRNMLGKLLMEARLVL